MNRPAPILRQDSPYLDDLVPLRIDDFDDSGALNAEVRWRSIPHTKCLSWHLSKTNWRTLP